MQISSRETAVGVVRVCLSGEIDMATADDAERVLVETLERADLSEVIVDLAGVTFCDSSGIAVLDEQYARATARGVRLRIADAQPSVRRVLEIVGLFDALTKDR